jgi:hypothetical protein
MRMYVYVVHSHNNVHDVYIHHVLDLYVFSKSDVIELIYVLPV